MGNPSWVLQGDWCCLTQQQQHTPHTPHPTLAPHPTLELSEAPYRHWSGKQGCLWRGRRPPSPTPWQPGAGHLESWSPGSVCSTGSPSTCKSPPPGGGGLQDRYVVPCRLQTAPTCPRISCLKARHAGQGVEVGSW